jgi:hypothetical protein
MFRIAAVEQKAGRIVQMPAAAFVYPDERYIVLFPVDRVDNVFGRLQRHLVFGRFAAK